MTPSACPRYPRPRESGQIWLECLIGCVLILVSIAGVALFYVKRYQSYRAEIRAHPLVLPGSAFKSGSR